MEIKIAGLDYRSASLDTRSRFSFTQTEREAFLRGLEPYAEEAVLISTCNRTELIVFSDGDPAEMLRRSRGCGEFFTTSGERAVRRIFELAAGLHSQIPLEDQILGQMKEALTAARDAQSAGPVLSQLFQRAIAAGKEIRTIYKKMPHESSAAEAACSAAQEYFGSLRGTDALIVGSGEMGMLAAQLLTQRGASVSMTQRRRRKDGALPPSGVKVIDFDSRYDGMKGAALVICATASPHLVLAPSEFPDDGKRRLLIDLAVPRDIDPAFAKRASVTLIDMDGLGQSPLSPEFLTEIGEKMNEYAKAYSEWRKVRDCMPYIEDVCAYAERELTDELGAGGEDAEKLRAASRRMINKLLFTLKERSGIDMAKECYCALAKAAQR